jgi:hypothetical protein
VGLAAAARGGVDLAHRPERASTLAALQDARTWQVRSADRPDPS